jgi:ABC-type multidrug transport system fused ATPase/permease subunit
MGKKSLVKVFALALRRKWEFMGALVALAAGSGINLLFPEVARIFIDDISRNNEIQWFVMVAVLSGLFIFQAICFYFRSLLFGIMGNRIACDLRGRAFERMVSRPIPFFDMNHPSELVSRLTADVQMVQVSIAMALSVFLRYSFQVIGGGVMMLLLSPFLSLLLLLSVPVLVAISFILVKKLRAKTKRQQEALGSSAQVAEEVLSGIDMVKAYGVQNSEVQRYINLSVEVCKRGEERTFVSAFFQSFVSLLLHLFLVGSFLYAIHMVRSGTIGVSLLAEFLMYGAIVAVSFALLSNSISDLVQASAALERIQEFLVDRIDLERKNRPAPNRLSAAEISFSSVFFSFPSRPDLEVLSGVDLEIEPGKVTAIIGASGSGKSAILALLMGFYDPSQGEVLVGGESLAEFNVDSYRSQIGYVPQGSTLFGISIRENLLFGKLDATDEEVWNVIRTVRLDEFINSLSEGLDTILGARGTQVSGGQRQRLAIARALLRNPDLIILDEATSSLDGENEREILESLIDKNQAQTDLRVGSIPKTIIFVTHRLSSLKFADCAYVINGGKIEGRISRAEFHTLTGVMS